MLVSWTLDSGRLSAGRQTGSTAWRAARGELGNQTALESCSLDPKEAETSSKAQAAPNASDIPFTAGTPATALPQLRSGGAVPGNAPKSASKPEPGFVRGQGQGDADMPRKPDNDCQEALGRTYHHDPDIAEDLERRARLRPSNPQHWVPEPSSSDKRSKHEAASGKAAANPKAPISVKDIAVSPDATPANAATASQGHDSTASSGKQHQQQSPQQEKDAFAKAVKTEFVKLMAAGRGITPNQAAVEALQNVKKRHGL